MFRYSACDYFYNLFCLCKTKCCCKTSQNSTYSRYKLYQNGEEKLNKEMDCVSFVKAKRKVEMMMEAMMDKNKQLLARYSQQHVIHCYDESGNSSDEFEDGQVPMLREKRTVITQHEDRIEKFRSKYSQEVHTLKDFKLLHGVYTTEKLPAEFIERVRQVTSDAKEPDTALDSRNRRIKGPNLTS